MPAPRPRRSSWISFPRAPAADPVPSRRRLGPEGERRVRRHYRLRGWTVLAANERPGGVEVDLVVRRGRTVRFVEVKARSGTRFGEPAEAVTEAKRARLRRAATAYLAAHPELARLEVGFEAAAVRGRRIERVAFE
jgi:putative endonuclease